jgi:predicted enzyme related to lactoylglutathione lyase
MTEPGPVRQLRLCIAATDYDAAVRFYRDVLGLPERESYSTEDGRVMILNAGIATLELADPKHSEYIDQVEVGRRVAGHVRVAFEVDDCPAVTNALTGAGAQLIAAPTRTPWNSLNARLDGPAGLQLTIFAELA